MKFSTAAALFPLTASALVARQNGWPAYDAETDVLKEDGLCRAYKTLDPPPEASGLEMCDDLCAPAREITSDDAIFSISCIATGQAMPEFPDPSGARYNIGECKCNHPLINWVAEAVIIEGLPAIGRVTCAVWKLAASEAAQLIAGTLTGMNGGAQTLAKVARMINSLGNGAGDWEAWVSEVSEGDGACDFSPQQLLEDFTGLTEEDLSAVN